MLSLGMSPVQVFWLLGKQKNRKCFSLHILLLAKKVQREVGHELEGIYKQVPEQPLTWIFYQRAALPEPGQSLSEILCKAKA